MPPGQWPSPRGSSKRSGCGPDLLPVRVGVHTGPVVMLGGDWYGSAVNVAARLAAEATANEALISWATRSAACGDLGWTAKHHCEVVLRGVERPVAVWRLTSRTTTDRAVLAGQGAR